MALKYLEVKEKWKIKGSYDYKKYYATKAHLCVRSTTFPSTYTLPKWELVPYVLHKKIGYGSTGKFSFEYTL